MLIVFYMDNRDKIIGFVYIKVYENQKKSIVKSRRQTPGRKRKMRMATPADTKLEVVVHG